MGSDLCGVGFNRYAQLTRSPRGYVDDEEEGGGEVGVIRSEGVDDSLTRVARRVGAGGWLGVAHRTRLRDLH